MLLRGKRRENLNILSVIKTVTKQHRGKYWRKKLKLYISSDFSLYLITVKDINKKSFEERTFLPSGCPKRLDRLSFLLWPSQSRYSIKNRPISKEQGPVSTPYPRVLTGEILGFPVPFLSPQALSQNMLQLQCRDSHCILFLIRATGKRTTCPRHVVRAPLGFRSFIVRRKQETEIAYIYQKLCYEISSNPGPQTN